MTAAGLLCAWCNGPIPADARKDSKFCCKSHRQAAHRFAQAIVVRARAAQPLRVAYADPPYPGLAKKYYQHHPDYAGEVDHRELLSRLQAYDGWALSTSEDALPMVLGLCAELGIAAGVGAWFRGCRPGPSKGPRSAWEPVVYVCARAVPLEDPTLDALVHHSHARTTDPARVIGSKPAEFCSWLFGLIGALPGDSFDDLYPGSGGVGRAWRVYTSREYSNDGSLLQEGHASQLEAMDASAAGKNDVSRPGSLDAFRAAHLDTSPRWMFDASTSPAADASAPGDHDASPAGIRDASPRGMGDTSTPAPRDGCAA